MLRVTLVLVPLLVCVAAILPGAAQDPPVSRGASNEASRIASEQPMSIFNDEVRCFKFAIEETLITADTAQDFMRMHAVRNDPEIIGAYADVTSNALVVVGPPEAEHSIRVTLATWMVARQGVSPLPLIVQLRTLTFRRSELLRDLAELEVASIEADDAQSEQIRDRMREFEQQITTVEKQMEVVEWYIEREASHFGSNVAVGK